MKRIVTLLVATATLCSWLQPAMAATGLVSAPLKGGAGGVVCSCVNLSNDIIVVDFSIRRENGASICPNEAMGPGFFDTCYLSTTEVAICRVFRTDGKSASSKQLTCSLSALDAAGNPLDTVPLDNKAKQ